MADGDYPSYRVATGSGAAGGAVLPVDPNVPSYRFAVADDRSSGRLGSTSGSQPYSPQSPPPQSGGPPMSSYRFAVVAQPPAAVYGSQYSIHSASAGPAPGQFAGYKGSVLGSSRATSLASVSTYPGAVYDAETNTYTVEGWPWRQPEPKRSLYGFTVGLSILSFICCCWPLSALALASACSSDKAWRNGDELTMHTRGKLAVILIMLAAIFGAILIFCSVIAIRATIANRSDSIFN